VRLRSGTVLSGCRELSKCSWGSIAVQFETYYNNRDTIMLRNVLTKAFIVFFSFEILDFEVRVIRKNSLTYFFELISQESGEVGSRRIIFSIKY
jgi:hypothetical protein